MDVSTYAHDALNGIVHCIGPYDVWDVFQLLKSSTLEQSEAAKASISMRSYYRWWPPASLRNLAGYLVAEAHGGADCTPYDAPSQAAAAAIETLYAQVQQPAEVVDGAEPPPESGAPPDGTGPGEELVNGAEPAAVPSWIGPAAIVGVIALFALRRTP